MIGRDRLLTYLYLPVFHSLRRTATRLTEARIVRCGFAVVGPAAMPNASDLFVKALENEGVQLRKRKGLS